MGFYHNNNEKEASKKGSSSELIAFLARVADDVEISDEPRSVSFLAHEIGKKLFSFMLKPDDDPELRRRWKQVLGLQTSVLEIMAAGNVGGSGEYFW
ncbi:hypothetical protein F5X99DRAFT_414180 [Biscogniauxia marginata]|nr:hypothetical protein F5X99DRAFT_414180 [Biscogniauxia marginata]